MSKCDIETFGGRVINQTSHRLRKSSRKRHGERNCEILWSQMMQRFGWWVWRKTFWKFIFSLISPLINFVHNKCARDLPYENMFFHQDPRMFVCNINSQLISFFDNQYVHEDRSPECSFTTSTRTCLYTSKIDIFIKIATHNGRSHIKAHILASFMIFSLRSRQENSFTT